MVLMWLKMKATRVNNCKVGSMDIDALYLSIDRATGARIVAEDLERGKVQYKGVDLRKAAIQLTETVDLET